MNLMRIDETFLSTVHTICLCKAQMTGIFVQKFMWAAHDLNASCALLLFFGCPLVSRFCWIFYSVHSIVIRKLKNTM